jgi:hypothetical protein
MWTAFLAVATLAVAVFTAALARSTRNLARSSAGDQRSQWRPIVIPGGQGIDETIEGELGVSLRNVGRGPALGLYGELRCGNVPCGASIPGQFNIIAPEDGLEMRLRLNAPAPRGSLMRARFTYYDAAEQWHHTDVVLAARPSLDGSGGPRRVARTDIEETGRYLTAGQGSRRAARQTADRQRRTCPLSGIPQAMKARKSAD